MKTLGVALGGGGTRGLAHIGVLQVLAEANLLPDFISGTSAGSVIAALWASGLSPYQLEELACRLNPEKYLDYNVSGFLRFLLGQILPGPEVTFDGIIKGNRIEKLIYQLTGGKTLAQASLPLAIIGCDIDSGRMVIFTNRDIAIEDSRVIIVREALLSEAVRSSISIPATFVPFWLEDMQMVDGGLQSMVPVLVQRSMGAEYVLAVNLGKTGYEQPVKGLSEIISRTIDILTYETSEMEEQLYADLIIYPQVGKIPVSEMQVRAKEAIRIGRRAMRKSLDELLVGVG